MLVHILKHIPDHKVYTEAFAGGATVLFAKEKSEIEVINDTNSELVNFYQVVKNQFYDLKKEINATLHSRDVHCLAGFIYNYPQFFSPVKRAWAIWTLSKMSFSSKLDGSFGYDVGKATVTKKINNSKIAFTEEIMNRLEGITIENTDGRKIISSRDSVDIFHFVDPPYVNTEMGHYAGSFANEDFSLLLKVLSGLKGKFMLTMFPNEELSAYVSEYSWNVVEVSRTISASKVNRRKQVELMVMNY